MKFHVKLAADESPEPESLSASQVLGLKGAFEDGTMAEALDFIVDRYTDLEELYDICEEIAKKDYFWEVATVKALAIQLFYDLLVKFPELNVNNDVDLSVTYWVQQGLPIIEKVLADATELRS